MRASAERRLALTCQPPPSPAFLGWSLNRGIAGVRRECEAQL